MTRSESSSGTTLLVWHSQEGFTYVEQDTECHELHVWRHVLEDCWGAAGLDDMMEACGYLRRVEHDFRVNFTSVPVENFDSTGRFAYSHDDAMRVFELLDAGNLLGLWHSHPDGNTQPSRQDWDGHPRGVPMFIVALDQDDPRAASVVRYDDEDRP